VLLPYSRGDLVDRVHREGEILEQSHTADGTRLCARVSAALAAATSPFAVTLAHD
jgi:GTP-binding protein HflX